MLGIGFRGRCIARGATWVIAATLLTSLLGGTRAHAQGPNSPRVLEWWQTADQEHRERKSRLERLGGGTAAPRLHEYRIGPSQVPGLPADVPVLRVVFQDRVFFDTAQWDLRPDAMAVIDAVVAVLRQDRPDVALFVAGHTDSRGTDEYNLDLSIKRATSVAAALLQRGAGVSTIHRIGFGEAAPLVPNDSDANMALNRRVEFLFASRPAAVSGWFGTQMNELCANPFAAMAVHCQKFAREWRRYQATTLSLSDLGGPTYVTPRMIDLGNAYGSLIIHDGWPYTIAGGMHLFYRGGVARRLRPASYFGPIDFGGTQFFASGYVSLPQSSCVRVSDNGCALAWRDVPTDDGAPEPYCVAFCPRSALFGNFGAPGAIIAGGASYQIVYGPHTIHRGNVLRRFNPASSLAALQAGGHTLYPTGYVAAGAEVCRGSAGNGCLLGWQGVPSLDGGADGQCVAYCPQPAAQVVDNTPVLPRPVDVPGTGGGGGCELYAFSSAGMTGTSLQTASDFPTLGQWDKQIASLRVVSGKWSFYSGGGYSGDALELEPDSYPTLNNWSNQISSFRCESRGPR